MFKPLLASFLLLAGLVPVQNVALAAPSPVTVRQCGPYRYEVQRFVDGHFVRVIDGSRVRSLFAQDVYTASGRTHVVSQCEASSLVFLQHSWGRYSTTHAFEALDPTQAELRIVQLGQENYGNYQSNTITPPDKTTQIEALLKAPTDPWSVERTELVSKRQIAPEAADMLNDRSYYTFNGTGGVTRSLAASNWNKTQALDSVVCANGIAYVLYEKQFALESTSTSTYPANQYVIERSGGGQRKLIPIPYTNNDWKVRSRSVLHPNFGDCFGENMAITVRDRTSIISKATSFVNYVDFSKSIDADYVNGLYYEEGELFHNKDGISGEARIRILNADGSVTDRKPVYFRNLAELPVYTWMRFDLDPRDSQKILVVLSQPTDSNNSSAQRVTTYWQEVNGTYVEVQRNIGEWKTRGYRGTQMTPVYVSRDPSVLTVRGYELAKPMFLHGLPTNNYTLVWQRIGPLEKDGTRKIWYAFKVNGVTQTWFAVVR